MPLFGKIVVIKRNGSDGTHFPLTASTCMFGRKTECDIRIQLPHVSKEHCKVEVRENKEVYVTNLSAVNPTQLNGKDINQPERLHHGDVLTIIDRSFRFEEARLHPARRRSTGENAKSNKWLEDEQSSDKGKASKLTRKSEGNVTKTSNASQSPHRGSSRERKDLSPFSELYEMFKNKVHSGQERAKSPGKLQAKNTTSPVASKKSNGNNPDSPKSPKSQLDATTPAEKALKSPQRGRQSSKNEQENQNDSDSGITRQDGRGKQSPRKSASKQPSENSVGDSKGNQSERRKSREMVRTPVKSDIKVHASNGSLSPQSKKTSPRRTPAKPHLKPEEKAVSKPLAKRRSSELELPEPPSKRKRVSFGGHLSPELFDKRLPPNSPLKRGATPARRSLSISTPYAVMRKSFGGFRHTAIKEMFETTKTTPTKGSSAKSSPNKPLARSSPAKTTPVKRSPAKMTTSKKSPSTVTPPRRSPIKTTLSKLMSNKKSPAKATPEKRSPHQKSPSSGKLSLGKATPSKQTPGKASPDKQSLAKFTPAKRSPGKTSPVKCSPGKSSPAKQSPAKFTPVKRSPGKASPAKRSPGKASPAKRSPAKATPAKRSPAKASPAKRSPAKASPAKRSPAKASPAKRSPAKATPSPAKLTPTIDFVASVTPRKSPLKIAPASFYTKGRFSISRIDTPPEITASVSNIGMQTPKKSRKSALLKKTPVRRSRKLEAFETLRSRRRSGATEANLLVAKSWADVVRIGVAKSQKKSVKNRNAHKTHGKRKPKPKTPARIMKELTSTGHADSPATILVGRAHTRTVNLTGYVPKVMKNQALKITADQNESLTGLKELFTTPVNGKRRKSGRLEGLSVDSPKSVVVNMSVMQTPEEIGEMVVSPINNSPPSTYKNQYSRDAVSRLLKNPVDLEKDSTESLSGNVTLKPYNNKRKSFGLTGVKRIMRTPKQKGEQVVDPVAIKKMLRTPKVVETLPVTNTKRLSDINNLVGVKRILKTPKQKGQPVEDFAGIGRIMKTPKLKEKPVEDMVGIKRIMSTPKEKGQPVEDMAGIKRIMRSPKVKGQPVEDMVGIKRIMRTPKMKGQPLEDLDGVSQIMSTPTENTRPIEEIFGMKQLIKTPPKKKAHCVTEVSSVILLSKEHTECLSESGRRLSGPFLNQSTKTFSSEAVEVLGGKIVRRGRPSKNQASSLSSIEGTEKSPKRLGTSVQFSNEQNPEVNSQKSPLEKTITLSSEIVQTVSKKRGRPSRNSLSGSLDAVNPGAVKSPERNSSPALLTHKQNPEESSKESLQKTSPEKVHPAEIVQSSTKKRGRPSRNSSLDLNKEKSPKRNSSHVQLTREKTPEKDSKESLENANTKKTTPTGIDQPASKRRGRPSRNSSLDTVNQGTEKSPGRNSTSALLTPKQNAEESSKESIQKASPEKMIQATEIVQTSAKKRGRPSKNSLSGPLDPVNQGAEKSPGRNSTSALLTHKQNPEESSNQSIQKTSPVKIAQTEIVQPSTKKRGRPSKNSSSGSLDLINKEVKESPKKNSPPAQLTHENPEGNNMEESFVEKSQPTSKKRGRPSKRSLSSSSDSFDKSLDSTDNPASSKLNESKVSAGSRKSTKRTTVDVPQSCETADNEQADLAESSEKTVKSIPKKSLRKTKTTTRNTKSTLSLSQPSENLVVDQDDKSAPLRRRGRPQKDLTANKAPEEQNDSLENSLELSKVRKTGRGRKKGEEAKPLADVEVITATVEESAEKETNKLSASKTSTRSARPRIQTPEKSLAVASKKTRGRQPKTARQENAIQLQEKIVVGKLQTELQEENSFANVESLSVRRGTRARGNNANSSLEIVTVEDALSAQNTHVHEQTPGSQSAKIRRGRKKLDTVSAAVESIKDSGKTDAVVPKAKDIKGKRSTRAKGGPQVEEPGSGIDADLKGKKSRVDSTEQPLPESGTVSAEENVVKVRSSRVKSVQWHPLLTVKENSEMVANDNVTNTSVPGIKRGIKSRQAIKESTVTVKRSRQEKSVETGSVTIQEVTEIDSLPLVDKPIGTPKTKRGRRQANMQLEKIAIPELLEGEIKTGGAEIVSSDLGMEVKSKAPNRKNTSKQNKKSLSDSIQSDTSIQLIDPVEDHITQKRGRRATRMDITNVVKNSEAAENVIPTKTRGKASSQTTLQTQSSNLPFEPPSKTVDQATILIESSEMANGSSRSKRGLKRKAGVVDFSDVLSKTEPSPAAVKKGTRGSTRQKSEKDIVNEKPMNAEVSPAKRLKKETTPNGKQKVGKPKAVVSRKENVKAIEAVKTRPSLRSRK